MVKLFAMLAVTVLAAPSWAQQAGHTRPKMFNACINAATMAATRTCTIDVQHHYAKVNVFLAVTDTATVTTMTVTPSCSNDGGTTYFSYASRAISAGTGTVSIYADTRAISGNENIMLEYDARSCDSMQFAVSSDGDASDLLTVDVVAIVGD